MLKGAQGEAPNRGRTGAWGGVREERGGNFTSFNQGSCIGGDQTPPIRGPRKGGFQTLGGAERNVLGEGGRGVGKRWFYKEGGEVSRRAPFERGVSTINGGGLPKRGFVKTSSKTLEIKTAKNRS